MIVRWSTRLGAATNAQTIRIRVLHRLSSEEFQFVSSGSLEPIPEGAGTYTFAASLPIAAGDEVGLESESGKQITYQAELAETHSVVFSPLGTRPDGSPTGTPVFDNAALEAAFNFEVLADCDHDGLGDETQDADLPPACKPPVAAPSNAFSLGKPKLNKKKGTAKEPVTVPGPGTLTLTGKGVVDQTKTSTAAATVNLLVKSKGKQKKKLNKAGKVEVKVTVTFTPTGGTTSSQSRRLVLRKRLH